MQYCSGSVHQSTFGQCLEEDFYDRKLCHDLILNYGKWGAAGDVRKLCHENCVMIGFSIMISEEQLVMLENCVMKTVSWSDSQLW
jgi:hypothetical protein